MRDAGTVGIRLSWARFMVYLLTRKYFIPSRQALAQLPAWSRFQEVTSRWSRRGSGSGSEARFLSRKTPRSTENKHSATAAPATWNVYQKLVELSPLTTRKPRGKICGWATARCWNLGNSAQTLRRRLSLSRLAVTTCLWSLLFLSRRSGCVSPFVQNFPLVLLKTLDTQINRIHLHPWSQHLN